MPVARSRLASPVPDKLPPALSSMWRLCKLGYQHEPRLVAGLLPARPPVRPARRASGALAQAAGRRPARSTDTELVYTAAALLGLSAAATWFLRTVSTRVQRGFRDKVTIALESHVARLQATVATIAHQERPDYLDRLSVLRNQVFVLDHMYMSLFSTCGWILRLAVTVGAVDVDPPGAGPVGSVCRADCSHVDVAARRRTGRPGTRRPVQPPGPTPLQHGHHRDARQRGPADGHRHRGWPPIAARPGRRWNDSDRGRPLGNGRVAHAGLGHLRRRLRRRGRLRVDGPSRRRPATCCSCWRPARVCPRTSARPSARSVSSAASGWTARAAWPGSRTTPPRSSPRPICPSPRDSRAVFASNMSRSPIPAPSGWSSTT